MGLGRLGQRQGGLQAHPQPETPPGAALVLGLVVFLQEGAELVDRFLRVGA